MKKILYLVILSLYPFIDIQGQHSLDKIENGALLVRLATNQHLIDYYLDNLEIEKANNIIKEQKIKNKHIIKSFQSEWSLCPVYFFYSHHYTEIAKNQFNHVFKDLNQTKLSESEKRHLTNNVLIAFFGKTPGSSNFDALVLTDQQLKQLPQSTPRYVRTYHGFWLLERKIQKTIRILHKKITYRLRKK
tara:strand:+ start:699 stop:1265 length:567 start_codon:yes stop_codon:yes gene_type:complete